MYYSEQELVVRNVPGSMKLKPSNENLSLSDATLLTQQIALFRSNYSSLVIKQHHYNITKSLMGVPPKDLTELRQ